jgi:thiol-disulfide isomerase/thioredoxin
MPYLTAAVVLVGVLGLLNLVLTVGVIRRLRGEGASTMVDGDGVEVTPNVGDEIGDFLTSTVDGEPVSRASMAGTLVAFLSPTCPPCRAAVPDLVRYADGPGAGQVTAVVTGDEHEVASLVSTLGPVARVITEEPFGPVSTAFAVRSFPTFCRVTGDATVAAVGFTLSAVTESDRARARAR